MNAIDSLDRAWTLAINGIHSPASDSFWIFVTTSRNWFVLYALIIALMFWKLGWKKTLAALVAVGLTILCSDQICNLVKNTVCRLRPGNDPDMLAAGLWTPMKPSKQIYGFFSAHAATCFGIAMCSVLALKAGLTRGWHASYAAFILIWASLIGLSRIHVARHFLGDVIVGAAAGILIAWGVFALVDFLRRKIEAKLAEKTAKATSGETIAQE